MHHCVLEHPVFIVIHYRFDMLLVYSCQSLSKQTTKSFGEYSAESLEIKQLFALTYVQNHWTSWNPSPKESKILFTYHTIVNRIVLHHTEDFEAVYVKSHWICWNPSSIVQSEKYYLCTVNTKSMNLFGIPWI